MKRMIFLSASIFTSESLKEQVYDKLSQNQLIPESMTRKMTALAHMAILYDRSDRGVLPRPGGGRRRRNRFRGYDNEYLDKILDKILMST